MKIIYMGTPDFAVNTLECLINSEHEVACVFTQPDKPQGRKQILTAPPVKTSALNYSIPVYQPVKIRERENLEIIRSFNPDVIVVAAFGQILPKELLEIPQYGCINVHASLLPLYRGAAPIQWSIINGDKETGITIMKMNEGIDTGDIILQEKTDISDYETADTLFDKLASMGGPLLLKALGQIETGTAVFTKQDDRAACTVKMIKKEDGHINWNDSAVHIERLVRGLNSWPCAYTFLDKAQIKLWKCETADIECSGKVPGQIIIKDGCIYVASGDGTLKICELQLAGKKRMNSSDFLRGYRDMDGKILE